MECDYRKMVISLREKLVLSQEEMAKRLGVSFATVNRWEGGLHKPTYEMKRKILALCKKYGIETITKEN